MNEKDCPATNEYLLSMVKPDGDCLIWQGRLNGSGYGVLQHRHKGVMAHRVFYHRWLGPIPEGMEVCHRCDVKNCVNPDHLWVGTHRENMIDARNKGKFEGTGGWEKRLTADAVRAIRAVGDITRAALEFGMSYNRTYKIYRRMAYRWVE